MEGVDDVLNTEVAGGMTLGDIFSVEFLTSMLGDLAVAALILFFGFYIAGWVKRRIRRIFEHSEHLDDTLGGFLGSLARYGILALAVIFVLQTFGFQTTSLVALLGAAGLAVGLALQGVLSGFAAGFMLVLFRPIKIGDFVEVAGQAGTVKDINIFTTELVTIANVQVIIPNGQVWGDTIVNYSAFDTRRAEWTFGVGYGANLADAERIIRDTIMGDERSLTDPEPFIQVNNLGDFSVDFLVRVWVPSAEFFQYQADMKRKVKEALDAGGVDIPFPTRTVLTHSEA